MTFTIEEVCLMIHDGLCSRADCSNCTDQPDDGEV